MQGIIVANPEPPRPDHRSAFGGLRWVSSRRSPILITERGGAGAEGGAATRPAADNVVRSEEEAAMNGPTWRIDDEDGTRRSPARRGPSWSPGGLRDALARTWRIWVGATIVGGVLGVVALLALPGSASASTTLLMVTPTPVSRP